MLRGRDVDPIGEFGGIPGGRGASGAGGRGAGIGIRATGVLAFFAAGRCVAGLRAVVFCAVWRFVVFFAVDVRAGRRLVVFFAVDPVGRLLADFFAVVLRAVRRLVAFFAVVFRAGRRLVVFLAAVFRAGRRRFLAALFLAARLRGGMDIPPVFVAFAPIANARLMRQLQRAFLNHTSGSRQKNWSGDAVESERAC